MTTASTFPPCLVAAGISRAPGTNNDRNRSQSPFLRAAPEFTAYSAATIEVSEATSAGLAWGAAAGGEVCCTRASPPNTVAATINAIDIRLTHVVGNNLIIMISSRSDADQ